MLSSLPPELLRDIIEATVPHTSHSRTYKNRQRTLCALSLVSKLFRSIAQPLLLEIVYVKSIKQVESMPSSIDDGGGGTRRLNGVRCVLIETNHSSEFEELLPKFFSVASLTLSASDLPCLEVALPSSLGNLSSLHLSCCRVTNVRPIVLPNLRSLTLFYTDMEDTAVLLDPVSLPRLEELAWYDDPAKINDTIGHSSFRQLLPQLEVLVFPLFVWRDLADTQVRSAASRILVEWSSVELSDLSKSPFHPVNLRASGLSSLDQRTGLTTLHAATADLAAYIESNPSLRLRSVYLSCDNPSTVHLSNTSQGYLENLSRVCQQRNIDLIFEIGPSYRLIDPCFSANFSRKMKEQRRPENVE